MGTPKVRHARADSPLRGEGSKAQLATVTSGEYLDKTVGIMVEYTDGWCICDMGGDDPMELIHIRDMRLWQHVKSIDCTGPVPVIEPLDDEDEDDLDERGGSSGSGEQTP